MVARLMTLSIMHAFLMMVNDLCCEYGKCIGRASNKIENTSVVSAGIELPMTQKTTFTI